MKEEQNPVVEIVVPPGFRRLAVGDVVTDKDLRLHELGKVWGPVDKWFVGASYGDDTFPIIRRVK